MTAPRDPDRLIHAFFAEGLDELPDPVYDAVRDRIEETRQRAVIGPWRTSNMARYLKVGLAAAAVVVIAVVGYQFLGNSNTGGPGATATPQPTATLEPTSSPATADAGLPHGRFEFLEFPNGMSMAVTIPASGWHFREQRSLFSKGDEYASVPEAWVMLQSNPAGTPFYVPGDPCRMNSTWPQSPATTVDDFVADLAAQDSGDASEPVDVTVGGYAGKSIILHVADDAVVEECEQGEFVRYGYAENRAWHSDYGAGEIDEFWILDVDGSVVVLAAMYRPDTSAELVEEMRTIAQSATFGTP